jgi:dihydroneopterin aldolase
MRPMPLKPSILPGRRLPQGAEQPEAERAYDKVWVRDLVLPVRIGVWSEEQNLPQRVRFAVELWACDCGHRPGDLTSVISYDFIVDGIREIACEGHVLLTETLAERIAAHCLAHRRAEKVRVAVEKLDRIPGASLGCEIVRMKAPGERWSD